MCVYVCANCGMRIHHKKSVYLRTSVVFQCVIVYVIPNKKDFVYKAIYMLPPKDWLADSR